MSINSFTYNGVSSESLGLYVGGQQTFGSPQRDVTKVSIPGRNGDLIRDNGRFLNAQIAYNVVAMSDFKNKAQSVRNWLMSARGYKRLEDTYHPEHYRMARVADSVDFETGAFNATGKAKIIFDCMPQRFLKSGETVISGDPVERSASGEIASFETDYVVPMTSAEVSLSPIQDLNGYDSPWPAGGGKNKVGLSHSPAYAQYVSGVSIDAQTDDTLTLTSNATATYACVRLFYALPEGTYTIKFNGTSSDSYAPTVSVYNRETGTLISGWGGIGSNTARTATLSADTTIDIRLFATLNTATARTVTFTEFQLESGSSATAYAPYSNVCPISGHTGATLFRTGKNLFDVESRVVGETNANGTATPDRYTLNDGVVSINSSLASYGRTMMSAQYLRAGTYTLSFEFSLSGTGNCAFSVRDMSANPKVDIVSETRFYTSPASKTFTLTGDGEIAVSILPNNSAAGTLTATNIQLELGSTASSYEPYQGDTYSVTFTDQGTVYGGTVDFVTGEGMITWASHEVTTTEGDTATIGGAFCRRIRMDDLKASGNSTNYFSSHFVKPTGSISANPDNGVISNVYWNANNIAMRNDALTTRDAWDNWVTAQATAGTPVTICYKLATPITFTLSPQQIETLLGENNVWSDAGEISLTFYDPAELDNPTLFDSKPLIRAYGSGNGQVVIGNQIIALTDIDGYIDIDCETMNCYNGVENCNSKVTLGAQGFPTLPPGITAVSFGGGVTKVEITPRWWEL